MPARGTLDPEAIARAKVFDPSSYKDEVKARVRELITKKVKGGKIVAPPEAPKPVVTDLMAAPVPVTRPDERSQAFGIRPGLPSRRRWSQTPG